MKTRCFSGLADTIGEIEISQHWVHRRPSPPKASGLDFREDRSHLKGNQQTPSTCSEVNEGEYRQD